MEVKEVQEYFKNAKEVRCLSDGIIHDLTKIKITREIHEWNSYFWIDYEFGNIQLTNGDKFAEIISYKNVYEITKEQLRSLTDPKVKEMFPDAFEEEMQQGKWYKRDNELLVWNNGGITYGFNNSGDYSILMHYTVSVDSILATEEEVFEALKNEAIKRGYKGKFNYTPFCNTLWTGLDAVFSNGKWSETFEYLEEVEASDNEYFTNSDKFLFGCKHVRGHYICFTKNENAISIKYIKKIK
jgi:hypothetical protein